MMPFVFRVGLFFGLFVSALSCNIETILETFGGFPVHIGLVSVLVFCVINTINSKLVMMGLTVPQTRSHPELFTPEQQLKQNSAGHKRCLEFAAALISCF